MSTESLINDLIIAQGTTVKDIRSAMSGNPGQAAGQASAIAATLTANGFTANNLLNAILEIDTASIIDDGFDSATTVFSSLYITSNYMRLNAFEATLDFGSFGNYVVVNQQINDTQDDIGSSLGKLQGQVNEINNTTIPDVWSELGAPINEQTYDGSYVVVDAVVDPANDTPSGAIGKLQGQINAIDLESIIDDVSPALDKTFSSQYSEDTFLSKIEANDTSISEGHFGVYAVANTSINASVDTVAAALGKLQGSVNSLSSAAQQAQNEFQAPFQFTSWINYNPVNSPIDPDVDNIGAAIGKLQGQIGGFIDDASTSTTTTWSSQEIDNRIQNVVDTAPAALDTLNELAAAIGDDANFAGTVTTSLANKANTSDVYTRTELGNTFTTRNYAADWAAAIS